MALMIRQYFEMRKARLQAQSELDKMEQAEKDLLYEIQVSNPKPAESTKDFWYVKDGGYTAKLQEKPVPLVTDWVEALDYIRSSGELDLLQKRLAESAVKARWDSGVDIPGISKDTKYVVTITKD